MLRHRGISVIKTGYVRVTSLQRLVFLHFVSLLLTSWFYDCFAYLLFIFRLPLAHRSVSVIIIGKVDATSLRHPFVVICNELSESCLL